MVVRGRAVQASTAATAIIVMVVLTVMPPAGATPAALAPAHTLGKAALSAAMTRPGFSAPSVYPVGAQAVAVADFTGDGRTDVAVATPNLSSFSGAETVALLMQTPGGTLGPPQYLAAHTGDLAFVSAVAADVTGDGLMDLLVGSSNGIDLFEQHGGGLQPGRLITAVGAREIKVADINGDGRPDLVMDTYNSGLATMLNLGGGQFAAPVTVSSGPTGYQDFSIGDVTGDGIVDIVGHHVTTVEVRAGRGDGTFAPPVEYPIPWPNDGGYGLALGDFNGDGRTDVAVTNSNNNPGSAVHVFYQTAAGTLGPATTLPSLDLADMIKAVDVNGDGRTDLVVAHGGWDYAGVYLQQPDGTFSPEQLYFMGRRYYDASSGLDVGDINGDGRPDIVIGDLGGLVVLRQLAGGAPAPTTLSAQASPATTVGAPISETATLNGGFYPTGTMRFTLYGPSDPTCAAASIFTTTAPVDGNGSYTSAPFIAPTAGTYHFRASYSGDANNTPVGPEDCTTDLAQTVSVANHAIFTYPSDGQSDVDTTKPFTWKPLAAAQAYYLVVGTRPYGTDLVNSGILPATRTSFPIPDLPAGIELNATLLTEVHGAWTGYQATIFTAAVGHAAFTNPLAGQVTVDTTKPFTWSPLPAAQAYILVAGTTLYGTDLLNSGILPASQASYPMPALPAGHTIYATLLTEVNGAWTRFQVITFTAAPRP